MYCKNCGKEIDDDSKFCKFCGANLSVVNKVDNTPIPQKGKLKLYLKAHLTYVLLIACWEVLNLILLFSKTFDDSLSCFFPFTSSSGTDIFGEDYVIHSFDPGYYDFTEFIFYGIFVPLLIYAIIKKRSNSNK